MQRRHEWIISVRKEACGTICQPYRENIRRLHRRTKPRLDYDRGIIALLFWSHPRLGRGRLILCQEPGVRSVAGELKIINPLVVRTRIHVNERLAIADPSLKRPIVGVNGSPRGKEY